MKILITGLKSYVGKQLEKRIKELNKNWSVDFISLREDSWRNKSFQEYDVIYHVASIVHKKEKEKDKEIYYSVNRDLTYQLASKAREEGVQSFIFLSTLAVYGLIGEIDKDIIIDNHTQLKPNTYYGESKLEAEELLLSLQTVNFKTCIVRAPMIYGPSSPGNYSSLRKLALLTPIFPEISNSRSMIFIDNLSDIVICIIENRISGVKLVGNSYNASTSIIVKEIREAKNKKTILSPKLGLLIIRFGKRSDLLKKIFGNLTYQKDATFKLSNSSNEIGLVSSIKKTEGATK
ncbi:NAD-dependent epimerase/dehydratase family protein [Planococcus maritimus]|uniref:NAD-dependent epimerase/dehydratase family protein n=1 Tax=Planococcus maritimus TaxID=192421 RepID=A0A7D7RVI2_PLAMR|nr:NAD-dependent epimerase/dehydratase family protein [Planococcus maritimus]QMT16762.1 NAD-dependent epimerase/dehydratase family protein [Planococcus maritimus]